MALLPSLREQVPAPSATTDAGSPIRWTTPGGIPVIFHAPPPLEGKESHDRNSLRLHLEHARLRLLRGFDQLLCLDGIEGVEHLPHQIETVRKVLRHFRGRVLLADEVGLGKTIEACLLVREYLLRGLLRRVLILVPAPLVSQWQEELAGKFKMSFSIPPRSGETDRSEYWAQTDRILCSLAFAKHAKRAHLVSAASWDLVIVDEAHHCKNRATRNWQLVNSLKRRHMFLLTATPVQNNLVELYNLLTLLEPGHLKTESQFKRQYVRRGNPRDPRNRERLRSLLGEVMVRNTRSLVQLDLPPRYAHTIVAQPATEEQRLNELLHAFLLARGKRSLSCSPGRQVGLAAETDASLTGQKDVTPDSIDSPVPKDRQGEHPRMTRMQLAALLAAQGSHPSAVEHALARYAGNDDEAARIAQHAATLRHTAKDEKLLEIVRKGGPHKMVVFVNFRRTLAQLQRLLADAGVPFSTFSGEQSAAEKDAAVDALRDEVSVMLCTESGGEGRNLQCADTLINYDLPWNPMKIEQRIGRVHRIGQTHEVFVFNLCTAGSLEARMLRLLDEKIRMFELVVGEVGSILGNLQGGEEFESLVLDMWIAARDDLELDRSFEELGDSLLKAQEQYLGAKQLDEALFGEDYE